MADFYDEMATAENSGGLANMQSPGKAGGVVHTNYFEYEATGDEDAGETIQLGITLPAGALIKDISLESEAMGNSQTLSIGDSASATRYAPATSVNAAARINLSTNMGYVVGTASGDNKILASVGVAALLDGQTIRGFIEYVHNA